MSIELAKEKPAYLVCADGTLALNGAGVEAKARYEKARADHERLANSRAGAILARLFQRHAWLDAVTLCFAVTSEYNDYGGTYRSVSCQAAAPRDVPEQALPEDLFPEGTFDPDAAVSLVEEELLDDDFDLYLGCAEEPEGYDDLTVSLERSAIATLLQQSPLDGSLASAAWGLARSGQA